MAFSFSYGLEKQFSEDLYEDFEQHTLEFYKKGNLYGLEKYWAFHHYQKSRDQKEPLKKHPELERLLRESTRIWMISEQVRRLQERMPAADLASKHRD